MGNQHMSGVAAIGGNPEVAICGAKVFLTGAAGGAGAAPDPGIDGDPSADDLLVGVWSHRVDYAGDLMP